MVLDLVVKKLKTKTPFTMSAYEHCRKCETECIITHAPKFRIFKISLYQCVHFFQFESYLSSRFEVLFWNWEKCKEDPTFQEGLLPQRS